MAAGIGDKTWGVFLDQHNSLLTLLDSHASLLAEMRKFCFDNSAILDLVQTRLNTAESLIATFKLSTESLAEVTKREEQVIKEAAKAPEPEILNVPIPSNTDKSKAHLAAEPLLDPSGFFTVDTNPTPIDQLYKEKPATAVKAKDNPKRKASGEQLHPRLVSENERLPKRPKNGHEREEQNLQQDEDDSFLKGVEARSRAKEERRKAKLDKKRKRQSVDSSASVKGPKNKKQKGKHEAILATAAPSSGPPEDQLVRNGKRPHMEPLNNATNGRASKKKRRGLKQ